MADPASYRPAAGEIPDKPGVYRFSDPSGRVVYVGKAKSLRSRLNSYFQDISGLHPRTQTMVMAASAVDWTLVGGEVEALQLEYTWIKEFDPRFNVKFRDDKSYPWLAVTVGEDVPRVMVVRGARRKGVRYFGPYTHAWAIRETVDLLLRVFPMRSCTQGVFRRAQQIGRPCLLGDIGKCAAPCVGRVSVDEHRSIVDDFTSFISGQTATYVRGLEREMAVAAAATEYERAAKLRDDISALRRVLEKNAIVFGDGTDADVIGLAEDPLEVAVQIFSVRGGRIRGQRGWVADIADDASTADLVERAVVKLYEGEPAESVPREVLVPLLPSGASTLTAWLDETRGAKTSLRVPQRGDKRELMVTVQQNAAQALARHKTKRSGDLTTRSLALDQIQQALALASAPLRIECFDVSNLQGTQIVASMVVFEDGLPKKADYKRFTLRLEGQNDVASMDEVITRRFQRMLRDRTEGADTPGIDPETGKPRRFTYAPSLVVVDGGAPQVAAAAQALERLGLGDIALCGLAKRLEEVWLPGEEDPVILPRSSEGLYLLQRVRDEAHRFAIAHHRGRRSKSMLESELDEVRGLGAVRRKALLLRFGSVKKLRAATVDDIAAVPGIGPRTAQSIADSLARNNETGKAVADDTETHDVSVDMATGEILEDS